MTALKKKPGAKKRKKVKVTKKRTPSLYSQLRKRAAYQNKLQQLLSFTEKKSAYKGKLAREQYWSKKFQASPISLAQAGLTLPREQPPHIPKRKTATFSTVFLPSPTLRKIETTREPLIVDKLKEYQFKLNFYELFGRPPGSEKEIRHFINID
ncbi:915_t:CDS:2 [Cetraspora pellucida]|uniref:915_t:CDS:1 n=1 Tax=Cetraspora pellucida TaxID=1433469 RepID=A0ACA9K741_9GLOM|nr:915_t:CDS:2 [Cetraspora pellucida]